jgi:hypothetical protein
LIKRSRALLGDSMALLTLTQCGPLRRRGDAGDGDGLHQCDVFVKSVGVIILMDVPRAVGC